MENCKMCGSVLAVRDVFHPHLGGEAPTVTTDDFESVTEFLQWCKWHGAKVEDLFLVSK